MDLTRDDHLTFPLANSIHSWNSSAFQVMSLSEIMPPSLTLRSKESVTDARKHADIKGVGKIDVKTCYRRGMVLKQSATSPIIQGGYCTLQTALWPWLNLRKIIFIFQMPDFFLVLVIV